jgi:hypothetical protein
LTLFYEEHHCELPSMPRAEAVVLEQADAHQRKHGFKPLLPVAGATGAEKTHCMKNHAAALLAARAATSRRAEKSPLA